MKASDELFQLIKSLNKTEKGYFKKYASTHIIGEKNNYMKLFEAIDKQRVYDEEKIKEIFAKETFIKHLPSEKNYLSDLILRSLTSYSSSVSNEFRINELLLQIEVLFKKSLYKQCKKLLRKAKGLAYEYENNILLLNILDWEKVIIQSEFYYLKTENFIDDIFKEEQVIIEKIQSTSEYWKLAAKTYRLHTEQGTARNDEEVKEFAKVMATKHPWDVRQSMPFIAKIFRYNAHSIYYYYINDYKKSYEYLQKELALWESNPLQIKEHLSFYVLAVNNMILTYGRLNKYKEQKVYIEKLRQVPRQWSKIAYEDMDSKIFLRLCSYETDIYLKTGECEKGIALVPKIEVGLKEFGDKLVQKRILMTVYFNISYLYFISGNYSKALYWENKILNHPHIDIAEDIICFSKILNLLIHFEMNNDLLLEYVVKSTYRFLYKRDRLYKLENLILNFIRKKLPLMNTEKKRMESFKELREEIMEISKDPNETQFLQYFDFNEWLTSKIENRSFAEILRERAKIQEIVS
ncbi:MAG: hypothetical protein ABI207_00395 [Crocinitomicaceae bacterium]